jgi:GNAT superfamily N-acetyltransferase
MVVRSNARRQGIGRLLVTVLERVATDRGYTQVWFATGEDAVDFYRSCGCADEQSLTLASTGMTTIILTKRINT